MMGPFFGPDLASRLCLLQISLTPPSNDSEGKFSEFQRTQCKVCSHTHTHRQSSSSTRAFSLTWQPHGGRFDTSESSWKPLRFLCRLHKGVGVFYDPAPTWIVQNGRMDHLTLQPSQKINLQCMKLYSMRSLTASFRKLADCTVLVWSSVLLVSGGP